MPNSTTLTIYGKKQTTVPAVDSLQNDHLTLQEAYELSPVRSIAGNKETITLHSDELVELTFTDGTTWLGNDQTLQEIFPELKAQNRATNEVPVLPAYLYSDDPARSLAGSIALKLLKKFTRNEPAPDVLAIAESVENKALTREPGLYPLTENFELSSTPWKAVVTADSRILLFIHGTASSTVHAFGQLPGSNLWNQIQKQYDHIIALEHRTLTHSPFRNVLDLLKLLPNNSNIDIITHSRGGLVGELLVRFTENTDGFMQQSIQLLTEEKHADDIDCIQHIKKIRADKVITVHKFVRVACPARGTSLLNERTDIFLNALINLINAGPAGAVPVVQNLTALIAATVEGKNDFSTLPGLEAMRPDSAFIKALNTYNRYENENPIGFKNTLAVISGSGKFSISLNGLKVVLTKFFFQWQQNDLVVDTASMYQGAKRTTPVQYYLDDGTHTNHFNYFVNNTTRDAMQQALFATETLIPSFKEIQGENYDAAANRGIFGLENGCLKPTPAKGNKPIVLLLPGIMGSFLEQDGTSIWINYMRFATGALTRLNINPTDNIAATGVIKTAYNNLVSYLSTSYDVVVFPFDWRQSLQKAGALLKATIESLRELKQPIHLIGHSMGGLVIRDLIIHYPEVWKNLNQQHNFRTILLGTPWLGSFRIPHVLSGKDSIIKQLSLIDFVHSKRTLINMFAQFPGLLDLLPIHGDTDFSSTKVWEDFTNAAAAGTQVIPKSLLDAFGMYSKKIKEAIDNIDYTNIVYVAGKDDETISKYAIENGVLKFYATAEGDQSVTWESGIPKKINRQNALYYTQASHGSLANKPFMFKGIKDILDTGSTTVADFCRTPPPVAPANRSFECKEKFEFEASEQQIETNILGLGLIANTEETSSPILNISVSKGDLMFASYPLLIGHLANDGIYSAEIIANKYLKNALAMKHALGLYPGTTGTHVFFKNEDPFSHFPGCIIIGLGASENLNAYQLSFTVEKAVEDYLLTHCKNSKATTTKSIGLSTLIIGAGYAGIPIESCCRAIMQGVVNANEKVISVTQQQDLYVQELEFVELFEDKSISCFKSLQSLIQGNSDGMNIAWSSKCIKTMPGVRKRLIADASSEWWQRLSVLSVNHESKDTASEKTLSFYSGTNAAREEKRELRDNIELINTLFDDISAQNRWSFEKAKTIFELLIPSDFKENIRRNAPILWVLDKYSAAFPWELLQTGNAMEKPLCVSAGMIRQLATGEFKTSINLIKNNAALVIGDPNLNHFSKACQLPGAAMEAGKVYEILKDSPDLAIEAPLINSQCDEILVALFKTNYKIIHIAAHGFFDEKNPSLSGILIGKKKGTDDPLFITPQLIAQLPSPPDLVFINSCFLGKINPYAEELAAGRYKLAANIGTALIECGVKAVVVAGWEVDDAAACYFAQTFYEQMIKGYNFGDAVHYTRRQVYKNFKHTNTWGAFQCYGQPYFQLNISQPENKKLVYDIPQMAENDLDNIISQTQVSFYETKELLDRLKKISTAMHEAKFDLPELLQKEAMAYLELDDYDTAITVYNILLEKEDAGFSMKSFQYFENSRIKKLYRNYLAVQDVDEAFAATCLDSIHKSIQKLRDLLTVLNTAYGHSLIANAYTIQARVSTVLKVKKEMLEAAALHYFYAYQSSNNWKHYTRWLMLKLLLASTQKTVQQLYQQHGKKQKITWSIPDIEKTLRSFNKKNEDSDTDEYAILAQSTAVALCRFLLHPTAKASYTKLQKAFTDQWQRTVSIKKVSLMDTIDMLIHFATLLKNHRVAESFTNLKASLS